jgi:mannose-6-phosphate isomerase-like protein (cupin superfamily)
MAWVGALHMKLTALALSLLPLSCLAQQSAPAAPQIVVKGSDIANLISQSTASGSADGSRGMSSLLRQGPYKLNLEYHSGPSGVGLNEDAAELMVVMEGSGTILLGGTPADPTRTGAHLQARTAEGSVSYAVEKGDVIVIPQGLAHAIGPVGNRLILMSIHLPPDKTRCRGICRCLNSTR